MQCSPLNWDEIDIGSKLFEMGEYFYFTLSTILPLQTYVTNNLEDYYVLKL